MKRLITVVLIVFSIITNAGLFKTTIHSRANCLNNESITWWNGHPYTWKVVSIHKHYQMGIHHIDTGWQTNDRVAAVHWGEGAHGGFVVWGYHYLANYHEEAPFDSTYAETCNIIEGWN